MESWYVLWCPRSAACIAIFNFLYRNTCFASFTAPICHGNVVQWRPAGINDVMAKLNLGGGEKPMDGWETVDLFSSNPLYRVDLSVFPWPFADKSVDAVAMFHFLEHLNDVERTVQEVHRILKTGGEFWVIVPHAKNPTAWDISHRHCFSCVTFSTIAEKSYYRFNGKQLFKTLFFQMPLIHHRWIKWTPLDIISSRFPYFFEKFIPFAPAHIEWKGIAL